MFSQQPATPIQHDLVTSDKKILWNETKFNEMFWLSPPIHSSPPFWKCKLFLPKAKLRAQSYFLFRLVYHFSLFHFLSFYLLFFSLSFLKFLFLFYTRALLFFLTFLFFLSILPANLTIHEDTEMQMLATQRMKLIFKLKFCKFLHAPIFSSIASDLVNRTLQYC